MELISNNERSVPPYIYRQNASSFSWPPDPNEEWCYIELSPTALSESCIRILQRTVSVEIIAELFNSSEVSKSQAYASYASHWRQELNKI